MVNEYIRLKSNLDPISLNDRMKYNPSILEFHLSESDLSNPEQIIDCIRYVGSHGIKVYLHHPSRYRGCYLDIISENKEVRDYYNWSTALLIDICKAENTKLIIHAHYARSECSDLSDAKKLVDLQARIEHFQNTGKDVLLWENTIEGLFSYANPHFHADLVEKLQIALCFDVSHAFLSFQGDNVKLEGALQESQNYIHYFHVVDSMGIKHDGLPLGKGLVEWTMVKPYLKDKDFIFEIELRESNHLDCGPMIESARYLLAI